MATDFVVMLAPQCADSVEAVLDAMELLDQIEAKLTVYRASSEVSRINADAAHGPVVVDEGTFGLLCRARDWGQLTAGAFDITAGPLVNAWGFDSRQGRKPPASEIAEALQKVGYQSLQLDPATRSVRFAKPGMAINLGAIGKGYALDETAAQLLQQGVTDFLIHGGQSSIIARGDQEEGSGKGWAVGLAHPTKPSRRLGGLRLHDAALGTSGSGKQFFHHRGRRYGHVIDPRSGQPAGDLLSLTVLLPSAADADACATGLFVAGAAEAIRFSQAFTGDAQTDRDPHEAVPMILAAATDRQDDVRVETYGEIDWVEQPTG